MLMNQFTAQVKRVGNSNMIIIPVSIPFEIKEKDFVLVQIGKITKEMAEEKKLFEKYQLFGENGAIFYNNKQIGKVNKIFFEIMAFRSGTTVGNEPMKWKQEELAVGVFSGRVFATELYKLFGPTTNLDFVIPVKININAEDKHGSKFAIEIDDMELNLKDGFTIGLRELRHAKITQKESLPE